jgi:DNA-binding transcriptional regulator PaaX
MDTNWRTCKRKRSYSTRAKASKSARRQGKRLYAYQCPACGKWHLTHYAPSECEHFEQYGER